jgi:lipoprotein-anchoring transpeptidase ErfK/SrfK
MALMIKFITFSSRLSVVVALLALVVSATAWQARAQSLFDTLHGGHGNGRATTVGDPALPSASARPAGNALRMALHGAREVVPFERSYPPGTVVVDTAERYLYLVQNGGTALRYAIGVAREGFEWRGSLPVTRKAPWPDWRPPPAMIARQPDLPRFVPGGEDNPLGARALYLGDTLYRIHGTNEEHTIGEPVSSGCIRMLNRDVIDLYERVKVGAQVVVL